MDQWQLCDLEAAPENTVIISVEGTDQCIYQKRYDDSSGYWVTAGSSAGYTSEDVYSYTGGVYAVLDRPEGLDWEVPD